MLWEAILHSLPPAPRTVKKDISPELEAIIVKCLEKDPNVRYQSAGELLGDLAELEVPSSGSWQRVVARRSIGPAKILLIAGIVLTVIAAAGLTWWERESTRLNSTHLGI